MPFDASSANLLPQFGHSEQLEFVGLDQRHDGAGPPQGDHVEIHLQVAFPLEAVQAAAPLARTERDANESTRIARLDDIDSQRVTQTRAAARAGRRVRAVSVQWRCGEFAFSIVGLRHRVATARDLDDAVCS